MAGHTLTFISHSNSVNFHKCLDKHPTKHLFSKHTVTRLKRLEGLQGGEDDRKWLHFDPLQAILPNNDVLNLWLFFSWITKHDIQKLSFHVPFDSFILDFLKLEAYQPAECHISIFWSLLFDALCLEVLCDWWQRRLIAWCLRFLFLLTYSACRTIRTD